MKKLIAILSLVLFINAAKAQTTNTEPAPAAASTNTTAGNDKQCHGVTKDCPHPCTAAEEKKCKGKDKDCAAHCEAMKASSSSESMSAEHANTGAVAAPMTGSTCTDMKGKKGKSCCAGMSKASAVSTDKKDEPASESTPK